MNKIIVIVLVNAILISSNAYSQDLIIDSLAINIVDNKNKLNDTDNYLKQKILLKQICDDQDKIILFLNDSINKINQNFENNKKYYKVFNFFSIKDESIFNSDYNDIQEKDIPIFLIPQWQLISEICSLNNLLSEIENKIKSFEKSKSEGHYNEMTPKEQQLILKRKIGKDFNESNLLINKIEEKITNDLWINQSVFYRPYLTEKYNNFLKIMFDE